eukprot:2432868-Rhodomonas_salina.1
MNKTHPFHPSSSLSFAHVLFLGFDLTYADSAKLSGYIAQDVAQLGRCAFACAPLIVAAINVTVAPRHGSLTRKPAAFAGSL